MVSYFYPAPLHVSASSGLRGSNFDSAPVLCLDKHSRSDDTDVILPLYAALPPREDGLLTNSSALYSGYGLGDDWFEGALLRPDLVLSDVARAINSSNVPQVTPHLLVTLFAANIALTVRLMPHEEKRTLFASGQSQWDLSGMAAWTQCGTRYPHQRIHCG